MPNDIRVNRFSTEIFVLLLSFFMFKQIWLFVLFPSSLRLLLILVIFAPSIITWDLFDWAEMTDTLSTFSTTRVFLGLVVLTNSWIVAELSVIPFAISLSSLIELTNDGLLQRHCWFSFERMLYLEVGTTKRGRLISICNEYQLYN